MQQISSLDNHIINNSDWVQFFYNIKFLFTSINLSSSSYGGASKFLTKVNYSYVSYFYILLIGVSYGTSFVNISSKCLRSFIPKTFGLKGGWIYLLDNIFQSISEKNSWFLIS